MNPSLLVYKLITKKKLSFSYPDAYDFILNLAHNRVLFWFASTYRNNVKNDAGKLLHNLYQVGLTIVHKRTQTKSEIAQIARQYKLDYSFVKEDKGLPDINSDIDLFVRTEDFNKWIEIFKTAGFTVSDHKEFLKERGQQRTVQKPGLYKIDLTAQFGWQNSEYFTTDFLWRGYNSNQKLLSKEADFTVNLATLIFKRMHVSLLDYLYFQKTLKTSINLLEIEKQAENYGWKKSLYATIRFLSEMQPDYDRFPVLFPISLYRTIFKERLESRQFSLNFWLYSIIAVTRYKVSVNNLPYHVWWFDRSLMSKVKHVPLNINV